MRILLIHFEVHCVRGELQCVRPARRDLDFFLERQKLIFSVNIYVFS